MLIQPYRNYLVHCKNKEQTEFIWNLIVLPRYKAWNILGQDIQINTYFYEHLILSIKDVTEKKYGDQVIFMEKFLHQNKSTKRSYSSSSSSRCPFCNGTIINDRCTDCMFDWDN